MFLRHLRVTGKIEDGQIAVHHALEGNGPELFIRVLLKSECQSVLKKSPYSSPLPMKAL